VAGFSLDRPTAFITNRDSPEVAWVTGQEWGTKEESDFGHGTSGEILGQPPDGTSFGLEGRCFARPRNPTV